MVRETSKEPTTSSIGGRESFFDHSVSEPASPETGGENAEQGEKNTEAYSTPKPPDETMKFDTFEEAYEHYRQYAQRHGFGMRLEYRKTIKDNTVSRVLLVCGKYGKPKTNKEETKDVQDPKGIVKKRKRGKVVRSGCPAHLYITHTDAWWRVKRFNDDHNHPLIRKPSLTKFLSSHRNIPKDEHDFLKILHGCNIETARQMQLMEWFYGNPKDVPYTTKDIANQRAKFRMEYRHADVGSTISYFQDMKAQDPDFYWRIKLDDEDRVENLFWIDGASRRAYARYNDVISFDTTYMTNMYKMHCAPFIGINNHGQSIQFGCGFVRNELSGNFVWLFNAFLHAMGGIAPKNIITDQDFAMRSAIDEVFIGIVHRNCRWHIMKKAQEKLGKLMADNDPLNNAFKDCVDNSLTGILLPTPH